MNALPGEELRALQSGSDPQGGYLVPPEQFVKQLIKAVDDQVAIRTFATTFQVPQAMSLGAPTLESDPATPTGPPNSPPARRTRPCRSASARSPRAHSPSASRSASSCCVRRSSARGAGHQSPQLQVRRHAGEGVPDRQWRRPASRRVHRIRQRHLDGARHLHRHIQPPPSPSMD